MADWHQGRRWLSSAERECITQTLKERVIRCSEVRFALLHGSFISDGPFRDIDLAVYVNPAGHQVVRSEYEIDLSVELTQRVHIPVDVRVLNEASVAFRYHALKGLVLFVRDEECLDGFRARTWDEYCDFAPFARQFFREAIGG